MMTNMDIINFFQIAANECSSSMKVLVAAVKFFLNLVRWLVPIVIIVLGSIDLFKAVASKDDKAVETARKTFISRLIYGVVIFLVPFFISLAFDLAGQAIKADANTDEKGQTDSSDLKGMDNAKDTNNFFTCWYEG